MDDAPTSGNSTTGQRVTWNAAQYAKTLHSRDVHQRDAISGFVHNPAVLGVVTTYIHNRVEESRTSHMESRISERPDRHLTDDEVAAWMTFLAS